MALSGMVWPDGLRISRVEVRLGRPGEELLEIPGGALQGVELGSPAWRLRTTLERSPDDGAGGFLDGLDVGSRVQVPLRGRTFAGKAGRFDLQGRPIGDPLVWSIAGAGQPHTDTASGVLASRLRLLSGAVAAADRPAMLDLLLVGPAAGQAAAGLSRLVRVVGRPEGVGGDWRADVVPALAVPAGEQWYAAAAGAVDCVKAPGGSWGGRDGDLFERAVVDWYEAR